MRSSIKTDLLLILYVLCFQFRVVCLLLSAVGPLSAFFY